MLRVACDSAAAAAAVERALCIRDGVDPASLTVTATGPRFFELDAANSFKIAVAGDCGVVDSLEAGDFQASISGGGVVTSVSLCGPGSLAVGYWAPPRAAGGPRSLSLSLFLGLWGAALPGTPWPLCGAMQDSVILAGVPGDTRRAFLEALTSDWLPKACVFTVLYRGSRDGMTAAAFHARCDNKGPTLLLVRSDNGCCFGGYASASWKLPEFPNMEPFVDADTFLFSVIGPWGGSGSLAGKR